MIRLIGRFLGIAVTLMMIAISALLALNNPEHVTLSLWPIETNLSLPLWLVIALSFGSGLLIGATAMLPSYLKTRFALRQKGKSLDKITKDTITKTISDSANQKEALPSR